jgi:hypothetical protein
VWDVALKIRERRMKNEQSLSPRLALGNPRRQIVVVESGKGRLAKKESSNTGEAQRYFSTTTEDVPVVCLWSIRKKKGIIQESENRV